MATQKGNVQVGDRVPDFTLPDKDGKPVSLHDYLGKTSIVLYFYPKDNTPGCTSEACSFRDSYEVFKDAGAEVIGVSSDTEDSHRKFASQYKLPFVLLSDNNGVLRKQLGVPNSFGILPGRVTYVIDKDGVVRHLFNSASPSNHVAEALKTLQAINA